jgi:hypothetical protein
MYFYRQLVPLAAVERHAKKMMGNHDNQPRRARDRANGIETRFRLSNEGNAGEPRRPPPLKPVVQVDADGHVGKLRRQ